MVVQFKRRTLGTLLTVSLLWLFACGAPEPSRRISGIGDGGTTEAARRPCRLLTVDDLQSVLGVEFSAGVPHQGTPPIAIIGMQHCLFSSKAAGGRPGPSVYAGLASVFPREVFDKYKNAVGAALQPVGSLGNEAVYSQFGITSNLVVLGKKEVIGVSLSFVQKDPRQVAETLAKRALERA